MDNQAREESIMAFEDFQKHSRQEKNEYEAQRDRLREQALVAAERAHAAYRRTVYGVIEPVFTVSDHRFMRTARIFA